MTAEPMYDEPLVRFVPAVPDSQGVKPHDQRFLPDLAVPVQAADRVTPPEQTSQDLVTTRAQRRRAAAPTRGWRGLLYRATGLDLGPSAAELHERGLVEQVTSSFTGTRRVLFVNPKGGVGKTTTCLGVASTFGTHRGRGVVAFDNNPTRGTLGLRAHQDTHRRTVTDLLAELPQVRRVGDLSGYTRAQRDAHFAVLASDEDPRLAVARDEADYLAVLEVLDTFYEVICVDTGNDVTAPVFTAALSSADQLVVVTGASWDSAHSASWLLDHLVQHGHRQLVERAVTVLNGPRGRDAASLREHFTRRTRAVHDVPFDPALESGDEMHLADLRPATRRAWLEVSASIASGFADRPAQAVHPSTQETS